MLSVRVVPELQRIDTLVATLDLSVDSVDPIIQNVYANHVVLAASGYVENATAQILSQYGENNGNQRVARYIERTVSRNNSLNCKKILQITTGRKCLKSRKFGVFPIALTGPGGHRSKARPHQAAKPLLTV